MSVQFDLRIERSREPRLSSAILLYGDHALGAFATVHRISVDAAGKATLLAGKPLSIAASRRLLTRLAPPSVGGDFLPESVLMTRGDEMIWYEPARMRHLGFKQSTQFPERSTGTLAGTGPTPGVIFHVSGAVWRIFAFTSRGRPTPDTPLYHAPTLNTHEDGEICAGSVRKPAGTTVECIQAWSDAFWNSNFVHANYDGVVAYRGSVTKLWRDALAGRFPRGFPNRVLKAHGFTLGQYINETRGKA